jgi:O-antigen ligase
MSQIEITTTRPETGRRIARPALWSRQSRLNDTTAWLLMIVVALAPVPLGSNRGFFWATTAVVVGLIGIFYSYRLSRLGETARYGFQHMRLSVVLAVLLGAFLVLQTVPVSLLGPWADVAKQYLSVVTPQGAVISPNTISFAPQSTWLMLLRMVTYAVFYLLMLQVATNHRRKAFVLNTALVIVTLYAIYGFVSLVQLGDTILGLPKWAYAGSATATFVNRNSFATFLAFGCVIAIALVAGKLVRSDDEEDGAAATRRFDSTILLYVLAYAIIVAALFATQSRMGFAAAVAGSLAIIVVSLSHYGRQGRLLAIVPIFVLAIVLGFFTYGQGLLERLGSVESASDVRFDLYAQVVQMILARPYLGYGGGAFELAYPLFHQPPVSADMVWDRAHNTYLSLWVELGLVAGSIPIVLLLAAGVRIIRGLGRVRADWTAKLAGLGVLVVAATHSLVDFSLEIQANTLLFLAIVATGVAGVARSGHSPTR